MGMAVGDALGTTYEFKRMEQPDYPALATGPATDVVGAGPFGLPAGAITDDTQLGICIARSLVERGGFDPADIAERYLAWLPGAFDVGRQTLGALDQLRDGTPYSSAGLTVWRERDRRPAGNGSLMRTVPIGVAFARRPLAQLVEASLVESMITHADPRCALACAAFNGAVRAALQASPPPMLPAAHAALALGAQRLRASWTGEDLEHLERAVTDLESDLAAATGETPGVNQPGLHIHETAGFVRVAFRLAFWHCVHTRSWRDALVDVASRGGDADTNAAIVGALLGARDGIEAIPAAWRDRVLAATQPGAPAWADAHHPRHLLALVETIPGSSTVDD